MMDDDRPGDPVSGDDAAEVPENPFWDFSLAVYARAGVAEACLALQDRHGLDVNVLLFGLWAGSQGRALAEGEFGRLLEAVHPWRAGAVLPLRALRRWLKGQTVAPKRPAEALRARIKADELAAEAVQQLLMVEILPLPEGAPAPAAGADNLRLYLHVLGVEADPADRAHLVTVLCGAHPDLAPDAAQALLSS